MLKMNKMLIWIVVVRLPRPMEGNGVTPIFKSLQNCQFHHRRLESLEHFNVLYIYHSEHYGLSFLDFTDAIFYKVSLFIYISIFASTLCMSFDLMIVLPPETLIPRISN